jgi:hypothetical protein
MMKFIMLAQGIGILVGGGSEEKFGATSAVGRFRLPSEQIIELSIIPLPLEPFLVLTPENIA